MPTEKLYYVNQYQREAQATVLSCVPAKGGFEILLDKTIFYPTGGGQPCDLGTISAANVLDVSDRDGEIIHLCDASLCVGETVLCKIDWERRFMLMQQHSGEHLVSGTVHNRFGYENVGFHMGSEVITIDFSGELSMQDLREVEAAVNDVIYQNIKTEFLYPDEKTLSTIPYRSKKALSGWVRIVKFGEIDSCACCGTHVAQTGEIGLVKLISTTKFHDGSRVELLCGKRALEYLNTIAEQNREISAILSAKPFATAAAVRRVSEELSSAQYRAVNLENRLFAMKANTLENNGDVILFEDAMQPDAVRRLADAVVQKCGGLCAVFSGEDGNYKYALGCRNADIRDTVKALNAALNGRGGGKPNFAQGSVTASRAEIEAFFQTQKKAKD